VHACVALKINLLFIQVFGIIRMLRNRTSIN
jgi:hypothetical protein